MTNNVLCAKCGESIDPADDTHYRVTEEERPVPDGDDMDFDDWFSRGWYVCSKCMGSVIDIHE